MVLKNLPKYFLAEIGTLKFILFFESDILFNRNQARAGNSLHLHQLKSLIQIFKKMFKDFELQGILDCRRDPWKAIQQRLTVNFFIFILLFFHFFHSRWRKRQRL